MHLSNLGKKGVILGRGYVLERAAGGRRRRRRQHGRQGPQRARRPCAAPATPAPARWPPGGVGRNIAENLARLGTRTHLVAAIGGDALGDQVLAATSAAGVHVEHVRRTARATGTYTAVLDADGELVVAVADMAATDELGPSTSTAARDLVTARRAAWCSTATSPRRPSASPSTWPPRPGCGWCWSR